MAYRSVTDSVVRPNMTSLQRICILLASLAVFLGYSFSFPSIETQWSSIRAGLILGALCATALIKFLPWVHLRWGLLIQAFCFSVIVGDHSFLDEKAKASFALWCITFLGLLFVLYHTTRKRMLNNAAFEARPDEAVSSNRR